MTAVAWAELHHLAQRLAKRHRLGAFDLVPLAPHDRRVTCWGDCEPEHASGVPLIRLRLHQLSAARRTKRPLARSTVLRFLCHELAHLREADHGRAHLALAERLLRDAVSSPLRG